MSEYYGTPAASSDFLAHYGVKGMRWGVRKAVDSGNSEKLRKHYLKAAKKLAKLSLNANQSFSKKRYNQAKSNMALGGTSSAALSAALTAAGNTRASLKDRALISAGAGLAGGLAGALANSKGVSAGRWVSDKGHKKAIAKRNDWRREMEYTFRGTKYGGRQQHQLHNDIVRLSEVSDPQGYARSQYLGASAQAKRQQTLDRIKYYSNQPAKKRRK